MTTTNISYTTGTLDTWATETALWSDSDSALTTWALSYSYVDYTLAVGETITTAEGVAKNFEKPETESFSFTESRVANYELNPSESVTFAESLNRSVGFIRGFAESVTFAESVGKLLDLNVFESVTFAEALRRAADLVISDMMIASDDMQLSDFAAFIDLGNIPGYEPWRNFVAGDYSYQYAMFRTVIESTNADRGLLTKFQVVVDVPDVIDRGSATVSNASAGVTISYNKLFHVVPEITLTATGGLTNPTVPEFYGSPTTTSFTVRLRDTIANTYVTGSLSWAAHGY